MSSQNESPDSPLEEVYPSSQRSLGHPSNGLGPRQNPTTLMHQTNTLMQSIRRTTELQNRMLEFLVQKTEDQAEREEEKEEIRKLQGVLRQSHVHAKNGNMDVNVQNAHSPYGPAGTETTQRAASVHSGRAMEDSDHLEKEDKHAQKGTKRQYEDAQEASSEASSETSSEEVADDHGINANPSRLVGPPANDFELQQRLDMVRKQLGKGSDPGPNSSKRLRNEDSK
jgi:hypothetical protein